MKKKLIPLTLALTLACSVAMAGPPIHHIPTAIVNSAPWMGNRPALTTGPASTMSVGVTTPSSARRVERRRDRHSSRSIPQSVGESVVVGKETCNVNDVEDGRVAEPGGAKGLDVVSGHERGSRASFTA